MISGKLLPRKVVGVSTPNVSQLFHYRKRGSASYIVREVLLVRERERYREKEIDGSDVTIFALNFLRWCLFPKQNLTHNLIFYFQ